MPQQGQVQETEREVAEETVCLISPYMTHQEFVTETVQDPVLQKIVGWMTSAWPPSKSLLSEAVPFHCIRDELSVMEGLLLRGDQFEVQLSMQYHLMKAAHESNPGTRRTKQRLRD